MLELVTGGELFDRYARPAMPSPAATEGDKPHPDGGGEDEDGGG